MATFLDLVKDLARESGTLAGGVNIGSVVNPVGRIDKMVGWVRKAWINIQNERQDWPWMQREFTAPLVAGQARYTGMSFLLDRFAQWTPDRPCFSTFTVWDPTIGQSDEGPIRQIDYDRWRRMYARGAPDPNRPTDWAISPMQELCLGATPDAVYMISGEYRLLPQILTADTDVPELPVQYHDAIVWEALNLLSVADEAPVQAGSSSGRYLLARQNLNRDYLPEITLGGGPIA